MKFEISKELAEDLVEVINFWAEQHSIVQCTGKHSIIWKCKSLEEALKNWEDEE